jgi:Rrf2 family protein
MLSRAAAIALRALVELAREPAATLSVTELARRQRLPQPMLEQILLRLRRAGLVEARRGRQGGYRLAQQAETLPLARVLQAVEAPRRPSAVRRGNDDSASAGEVPVPLALGAEMAPKEGVADLGEPAAADPTTLGASAGHRVEQQLRRRLERLVQLELQRLTLAELLYDQRSWEASLGPEGGVMVM